jgi:broad specificity phosphatase PhoE
MKVALIPCALTEWRQEGRVLGRAELLPTAEGEAGCLRWADTLQALGIQQVDHGPDELSKRTAALLARRLLASTKTVRSLAEVDFGLWTGLTDVDLEARYETAYRELCESPLNVSPPEGENLGDADARLRAFLKKQIKRDGKAALALVLRPLALAMAWCALDGQEPTVVWEVARRMTEPVIMEGNGPGLNQGRAA